MAYSGSLMFILDGKLAQQIVDRTMKIIGYNINVMNGQGVILASGDLDRINQQHEGALLAIANGRTVEIENETAQNLVGVKPGINLALKYQDQIIGVVGITGSPNEVRSYGELVKMTAEMIVEQSSLLEQLQWDRRHKEELIVQWVKGESPVSQLVEWAQRFDVDFNKPRVAAIIELETSHQGQLSMEGIRRVMELLEYPERDNLVAMLSMSQLVVLKPAFLQTNQWDPELEKVRINDLFSRLDKEPGIKIKIALGHYFEGSDGVPLSFQSAKETLAIGKQLRPNERQYLYQELSLPVLLSSLRQDWRGEQLIAPYLELVSRDKSEQLRKTLAAYVEHFGDLSKCAKSLFVHRNTLRYRLDKIHEITGLDVQELGGLLQLYLGLILYPYYQNKPNS